MRNAFQLQRDLVLHLELPILRHLAQPTVLATHGETHLATMSDPKTCAHYCLVVFSVGGYNGEGATPSTTEAQGDRTHQTSPPPTHTQVIVRAEVSNQSVIVHLRMGS